jgi:hypothetical protein
VRGTHRHHSQRCSCTACRCLRHGDCCVEQAFDAAAAGVVRNRGRSQSGEGRLTSGTTAPPDLSFSLDFAVLFALIIGSAHSAPTPFHRQVSHLERHGKTVYCVNPSAKTVETERLKRSLSALPVVPDVIDLIINPALGPEQMRMAAKLGIAHVFVQPVRGIGGCRPVSGWWQMLVGLYRKFPPDIRQ